MATTQTQAPPESVRLDELALQVGGSLEAVRYWITATKARVFTDWAGREVVTSDAAAEIVRSYKQAMAEQAAALDQYDAYVRDRERRYREAGESAFQKAVDQAMRDQYTADPGPGWAEGGRLYSNALGLWPPGRKFAQEAAEEARAEFERREPLLRFAEWQAQRGKEIGRAHV